LRGGDDAATQLAELTDEIVRLRRAVEATTDFVTFHTRTGRVLFANGAARAAIGLAVGEPLPDAGIRDFFSATTEQQAEIRDALADYGRWSGELDVHGRDRTIPASVVITGHRDAEGRYEYFSALARDITEQRAVDAARRRSEGALRAIVQSSPLAIFAVDGEGAVQVWNHACEELFGWTASESMGVPPPFAESADELRGLIALVFEGETVKSHEARGAARDGTVLDLDLALAPLRNAAGRIVSAVVVVADVTDQRRAEHALRESEVRFRSLVQNSSDMVTIVDAGNRVTYRSPSTWRFLGLDPEGDPEVAADLGLHEEDRPAVAAMFERLRAHPGSSETILYRFERDDGELRWIEMVATDHSDDPAVAGVVTNARDVTDRVEAEHTVRASEERLRESEARYRAVVDDQTELVCRYRPDATITFANRAFLEFFGVEGELGRATLVDLRPASERTEVLDRVTSFSVGRTVMTHIDREVALDGSQRWYEWTDRAFFDADGAVAEIQSVGHDVTEQRRATEFAARQTEILEKVARGVPLPETLRAIAAAVESHFPRFSCSITVLDDEGETLRIGDPPTLPHGLPESSSVPIIASTGGAVLGAVDVEGTEARGPDDEQQQTLLLLAQLASIAIERKAFEEQLAHQSMHDPLTGLPNRLLFTDRLGQAIARCLRTKSTVGVAFIDLDRFKNINDSLGHEAGDELLIEVARKLESVIRPGDTVARFGGDEFAILCEDLHADTARELTTEIAQRLLSTVIRPLVVRGTEMFVGASVGIALATEGDERPEDILRDADAAMNHAKDSGRGRFEVFDDTMRARAVNVHATENALHRALERGELRLFFQPVVCLADARCVGAEALLRWQHPERGLIGPAEFIPLAEETGLVVPMGWWVLEEASRYAARWQLEQAEDFVVSVNLSARQLVQPGLAERVAEVIDLTGAEPASLCFEITESVLMDDTETVIDVIGKVRALGAQFAIDDFGTGYSSLGYLKRFPVDVVKIDRAFVSGLGSDPGDAAIVSAVVGLAHALDLRVTAEGVETEEQLLALIDHGCDQAQGYFFSPPQPAPDLRDLIARTRTWRPPGATVMRPAGAARRRA